MGSAFNFRLVVKKLTKLQALEIETEEFSQEFPRNLQSSSLYFGLKNLKHLKNLNPDS